MVLKEFRCGTCDEPFDEFVSGQHQVIKCPHCGGTGGHRRVWSKAPSVIMRPAGYNLKPGEPGYSKLDPNLEKHTWQSN